MAIDYTPLDSEVARRFDGMTFPAFRRLLDLEPTVLHPEEGDQRRIQPLAIGAWADGAPVGLALGALPGDQEDAGELLSLYVLPAARRQGIADRLVSRFEDAVRDAGLSRLQTVYTTGKPGAGIFEHLIAGRRWSPPVTRMLVVKFTVAEAMTTTWYQKYRRRSSFEFFPWKELPRDELRRLQDSQAATGWIAEDLVPWKFAHRACEPHSSIGVRLDGEIVGWVINHQTGPESVRFTCSYIRRDLARRGRIVPLYSESIRRLSETSLTRCTLTVPMHHREMVAFVKRRCAPWVSFVGETRGSEKDLT